MINLIPPSAKRSLLLEYWIRVISVWLIIWSVALLVGICLLYPSYVLITHRVTVFETSADEASQKIATYESVSKSLTQASVEAKIIINESSSPHFSEFVSLFENLQGTGVEINKISLNRDDTGIAPIQLSGEADNRQALASFRDKLLAEKSIKTVDLPISNLASDKDIKFNITVTINNSEI
jgi:hypothetical protein